MPHHRARPSASHAIAAVALLAGLLMLAVIARSGGPLPLSALALLILPLVWVGCAARGRCCAPRAWARDMPMLRHRLRAVTRDQRVLQTILAVPRDRFVPRSARANAYLDAPLAIGAGQSISQPSIVSRMLELLELSPTDHVLDVGTGSGYHAALLALLVEHVWTIELHPRLSARAERTVRKLGIDNITFIVGDATCGLPHAGPFDAINVAAAAREGIPPTLEEQLAVGGRLLAPIGNETQHLVLARRTRAGVERTWLDAVRFVPLVEPRRFSQSTRRRGG